MPYTPTTFNSGTGPGIDAPVLNAMQTQYLQAVSSFNSNLLTPFVLTGFVATKDGTIASKLDVTNGTAYLTQPDSILCQRSLAAFNETTSAPSTTYFLDLNPDGSLSWGTAHSGDANHLTLATVTTDASSNILAVTDTRVTATSLLSAMVGLLNLPSGAKAGGSKIWTAGNDGAGSGLDADTLDGHDSTYFAVAGSNSAQVDATNAGSTSTPQVKSATNTGLSTEETTANGKTLAALIPTNNGTGTVRGLGLGYVDAAGAYHVTLQTDDTGALTYAPTGAHFRASSFFGGTGAGTFSHGFPGTPSWIGITDSQGSSTMTVGVDTYGSSTCHVNTGASHTWLGMAHG